nr:aldehyde dehydrogenase family protein [uncultured Xanthomonas sp.]
MRDTLSHYIDGQPVAFRGDEHAEVFDPATGAVQRHVPLGAAHAVEMAVRAAGAAFPGWAATPPLQRARVLFRFRELLERRADALARCISVERSEEHTSELQSPY